MSADFIEAKRSMEAFSIMREELKAEREIRADLLAACIEARVSMLGVACMERHVAMLDDAISKATGQKGGE